MTSPREALAARHVGETRGFRWRGGTEISRLEGLSDAVFAFAITLLVVSLEVYFISGPVQAVRGTVFGSRRRRLEGHALRAMSGGRAAEP